MPEGQGDFEDVPPQEFVGGTQEIGNRRFTGCTFSDVELYLQAPLSFLFVDCKFRGTTHLKIEPGLNAALISLLAQRDEAPVHDWLQRVLQFLEQPPLPSLH